MACQSWHISYGTLVMAHYLWHISYGTLVMAHWLWHIMVFSHWGSQHWGMRHKTERESASLLPGRWGAIVRCGPHLRRRRREHVSYGILVMAY